MSATTQPPVLSNSQVSLGANGFCCKFCDTEGCDVQLSCGCYLHARCCPVSPLSNLTVCISCHQPISGLKLMPMNFSEIDIAKETAKHLDVSKQRGKKRKNATIARLTGEMDIVNEPSDLRTGRWTKEETDYCDVLIKFFEDGKLPIIDGVKLNEFLSNMLKSKQSRLTKKMKNAKLSTRQYKSVIGYIPNVHEACLFSRLETEFFASIKCDLERAEIKFHMQKEWRELFSNYCVKVGQPLDANEWLYSVEELDRRASLLKDKERMVRRKVMMGHALNYDGSNNLERGVYIEAKNLSKLPNTATAPQNSVTSEFSEHDRNPISDYASPFIHRIRNLIKKFKIPFEHVDVWVPSYVNNDANECRLCFAGCGTADDKVLHNKVMALSGDEKFNLYSFGEYSQKFSFDVGCGLPGRVYSSGVASWEQGIQNAPLAKFERCGGAFQWSIQTVLGIPISSPTVGRIVVVFYSVHDRSRDLDLVNKIADDLSKLRPSPKWKLVVDVGAGPKQGSSAKETALRTELLNLIQKHTPADKNAPLAMYLPGYTSLRLLLLQDALSARDEALLKSALTCYESYKQAGRADADVASMTARDYMLLAKQDPTKRPEQQISASQAVPQVVSATTSSNHAMMPPGSDTPILRSLGINFDQLPSLGASPALQPIIPNPDAGMGQLALTSAQVSALLQHDAGMNASSQISALLQHDAGMNAPAP